MNEKLQKALSDIENMIAIQKDCLERGYMHGMLNGLICAYSAVSGEEPKFARVPGRKPNRINIRHKSRQMKVKKR
jgi:hypothetical protein